MELEEEQAKLNSEIAELTEILESDTRLRNVVSGELAAVSKQFGTERRTVLLEAGAAPSAALSVPLEVADDPCRVLLSSTGLLARTADGEPFEVSEKRSKHDVVVSAVAGHGAGGHRCGDVGGPGAATAGDRPRRRCRRRRRRRWRAAPRWASSCGWRRASGRWR